MRTNKDNIKKKTFIIAEIGSNHDQSIKKAYKLIDIAKRCGADAVKFQYLNYEKMYDDNNSEEFKSFFKQIELKYDWIKKLNQYSKKKKIIFFYSSCFPEAIEIATDLNLKITKIASPQFFSNPNLIKQSLSKKLLTICSTGYSNINEINSIFKKYNLVNNKNIILMHCLSKYPAKISEINLDYIKRYKELFKVKIGYSDHSMSTTLPALAVIKGAECIEKHLTINRSDIGPDHAFALEPEEFSTMVKNIKEADIIKNNFNLKEKKKIKLRNHFEIKMFFKKDFSKGKKISLKDLIFRRSKLSGVILRKIVLKSEKFILKRNKKKGQILKWKDLKQMH